MKRLILILAFLVLWAADGAAGEKEMLEDIYQYSGRVETPLPDNHRYGALVSYSPSIKGWWSALIITNGSEAASVMVKLISNSGTLRGMSFLELGPREMIPTMLSDLVSPHGTKLIDEQERNLPFQGYCAVYSTAGFSITSIFGYGSNSFTQGQQQGILFEGENE